MIILAGIIGTYTLFHESIAANDTLNRVFLLLISIHLFLMVLYRFRQQLLN